MNRELNSEIILVKNIKMDREYHHVLTFTNDQVVEICRKNMVISANNYSFIKGSENSIQVNWSYGTCLKGNYIAFQNPYYSNKWFFAFIDSVQYVSDGCTRINYTIDVCTTWEGYWDVTRCFVIREHVSDDTVGLHTLPENIELGEYINTEIKSADLLATHTCYILASTVQFAINSDGSVSVGANTGGGVYGGIKSAYIYYMFHTNTDGLANVLEAFANAGKSDAIGMIFLAPLQFVNDDNAFTDGDELANTVDVSSISWSAVCSEGGIEKPTFVDNHLPANNKLLTYPYCYLLLSNNNGGEVIYKYELFNRNEPNVTECLFDIHGVVTPGMNIKIIPINYGQDPTSTGTEYNYIESLVGPKFPIGGFNSDVYTNWLTQNGVNVGLNVTSGLIQAGAGAITLASGNIAGVGGVIGGGMSIANSMAQVYQQSFVPPQASGNTNSGDVSYAEGTCTFTAYQRSIKGEYARIIDLYFTKYGYKVNTLKIPQTFSRLYYNYIQIADDDIIGVSSNPNISVPDDAMDIINRVYRRGVTLWHSYDDFLNYSVYNQIITG